ncbi:MAG: Flp pilus assembly protein CpaB [Silvanigrellaceae bacterium]|nr:Flp pilus assembly protein CpaB [Silvanigrellaceae bacterium]
MNKSKLNWNSLNQTEYVDIKKTDLDQVKKQSQKLMSGKFRVFIPLAFLVTAAQFILFNLISRFDEQGASNALIPIVVASQKIPKGELLGDNNIDVVYYPIKDGIDFFIMSSELSKYLGKRVKIDVSEKTPLLKDMLFSGFQESHVPEKIPPGQRLFILEVSLGNLSGILKQGDRVDIIANLSIPHMARATETLLEAVEIRGIGEAIENHRGTNRSFNDSISFFVTPDEFKILSFIKQYANFSLALRNPNDISPNKSNSVTLNSLMHDDRIQKIIQNQKFKIIHGLNE